MSTKLYLVRRWGHHQAGDTIQVDDDEQARWLLGHQFAQHSPKETSVQGVAAAEGTHGADPRAGGDATRRRPVSMKSGDTRENRAWPVQGSPVQYNAGVAPTQNTGGGDGGDESNSDGPSSKVSGSGRRRTKS
jgi:hypothetical protein